MLFVVSRFENDAPIAIYHFLTSVDKNKIKNKKINIHNIAPRKVEKLVLYKCLLLLLVENLIVTFRSVHRSC